MAKRSRQLKEAKRGKNQSVRETKRTKGAQKSTLIKGKGLGEVSPSTSNRRKPKFAKD